MNPWYIYLSNNNFYHFLFFAKEGDPSDSKDNSKTSGIHLPIHSFTYSFIHSFIYTLFHLIIHLLILLLIHLPIHAFIHSFLCIHNSLCFSLAMHFCTHNNNTQRKPPQRLGGISENKSDIILNENSAFNYLLINYFSLGHQVSPIKPLLD